MTHPVLKKIPSPGKDCTLVPVPLTDETINERKDKILSKMREQGLKQIIVYGDVEHGSNFEYLVGFFTRFEEALFIMHDTGDCTLVLGNENLNKASKARVSCNVVHTSLFSLPNQPNRKDKTIRELLAEAGIESNVKTGLVGWKVFTSPMEDDDHIYDIPSYLVNTITDIVGDKDLLSNETKLFIGENGVRTTNNANEVAHYEFAAALASDCVLDAMDRLEEGVTEMELGDALDRYGQHTSIVTIASSGPRFIKGNMYPTDNKVAKGSPISLTVGYRGGSSSRSGFAVHNETEMPEGQQDWIERVAKPYHNCYARWLENIHIGMTGGELFGLVEKELPRSVYGWSLCPGHLTGEEEWMSSPVYEDSHEKLLSGMIFQIDIIPSVHGYGGVSAESTVVLADSQLKEAIQKAYPEMWERMMKRRAYMIDVLGIQLHEDVLPMCSTVAYLRPYLLEHSEAFVME